jgi:chromosomal replication initiator protein
MEQQCEAWSGFLEFVKKNTSISAFHNWLSPIEVVSHTPEKIVLKVPNIFVKEYLLTNFKQDLISFVPLFPSGEPALEFVIEKHDRKTRPFLIPQAAPVKPQDEKEEQEAAAFEAQLNSHYRFQTFIEGSSNQFVKSAAIGVANRPGMTYNPLFLHGGVGLGKTHLLHSIGHHIREHHKKLRVQCITTEAFINQIVDSLKNKSIDKLKRFYRSSVDVLLVDDIKFLQNRTNFEEEFANTFETLINQHKQIVITCDKPPTQLKLSERMVARMEWGLVAHIGVPDIETRVAILQAKAEQKGLTIPSTMAFRIAELIHNIRQLEGALNRLSAHSRLMHATINDDLIDRTLKDLFHLAPKEKVSIESILKGVSSVFQVRVSDLKGHARTKDIALPRQVAMFLAKELINESLVMIGASFGKTHSTILHACKNIETKVTSNDMLRRQIDMVRRNIDMQSA